MEAVSRVSASREVLPTFNIDVVTRLTMNNGL